MPLHEIDAIIPWPRLESVVAQHPHNHWRAIASVRRFISGSDDQMPSLPACAVHTAQCLQHAE